MPFTITLLTKAEIKALPTKDKKPPKTAKGECLQCGVCCDYYNCPAQHPVKCFCRVYDTRPVACRIWPTRAEQVKRVKCPGFTFD